MKELHWMDKMMKIQNQNVPADNNKFYIINQETMPYTKIKKKKI